MKIVFTPDWFLGKDVLIDGFSFIVLFIFSFLAIRYFRMNKKNRKFLYLGIGFGLIALAQIATILTKIVLYYDFSFTQEIGRAVIASQILKSVDIFYYLGFFFHKFLTLLGLYVIYRLPRKRKSYGDYFLVIYFIIISALVSKQFFYVFHLTALFFLIFIAGNYYEIYKKNKSTNTLILISAFGILALSQLIFVLSNIESMFVIGNIVELISYVILLVLILRIFQYGKKKKPYGHNIRYAGNRSRKK